MKHILKAGDIMEDNFGHSRIILDIYNSDCYFIEYNTFLNEKNYFYNPTKAVVSETAMLKRKKIGEIPEDILKKMRKDLLTISRAHNEAFMLAHDLLNKNELYAIGKFINN